MHLSWGCIKVETFDKPFKDAKLYPGGAREWDWNETGTRHVPGIQPADVQELLDHGSKVIILSKGMNERLQVEDRALQNLAEQDISAHVLQTEAAVELYNKLCESEAVGALIHSTC
jgi:hypothetical protein